jgi:hypothetical protein
MMEENIYTGAGAFYTVGSDRYPATVVAWKEFQSGENAGEIREVTVQGDAYRAISGQLPDAEYEFTPNPNGRVLVFRKNKQGRFVNVGGGSYLHVGERRFYYDPHF